MDNEWDMTKWTLQASLLQQSAKTATPHAPVGNIGFVSFLAIRFVIYTSEHVFVVYLHLLE